MTEQPFEVPVAGGVLRGHRGGSGPPALLLHGGPAIADYLGPVAAELADIVTTFRYTQRGTPPSGGEPPYTIETHAADALAVLDALGIDQAWAVGHSWGGHLALHLLVMHPERLLGVVCIAPLGAFEDVFADLDAGLRRGLTAEQNSRLDEIVAHRLAGDVTEDELVERWAMVWPYYFADPSRAGASPSAVGVQCSIQTNRSIAEHFQRRTLAQQLPDATLPVLFVHGELDPLPPRSSAETAALIPGAKVEVLPGLGHFFWLEQPGAVRTAVKAFLEASQGQA